MITQNIIGFELSALGDKQIQVFDPARQMLLPEIFSPATEEEIELAMKKAHLAWKVYRNLSGKRRAEFILAIAEGIEQLGVRLVERVMRETAYPEARVIVERNRTCAQLRMFAEVAESEQWRDITIDHALPDRTPVPRPDLRSMLFPIGPVVVFGASNFPLAYSTAGGDVASALAAGCPVVVKAHDSHLGTHALVAGVIMEAARVTEMPDGVFSSLIGDGFETGRQLVLHPLTAAVGFTGSRQGGRVLFDLGQQRPLPIPVFAEMGSVNPVFLLPGRIAENVSSLAAQLVTSMTMTAGQFCTNPGILIALDNPQTTKLISALASELEGIPAAPMLNAGIFKSFKKGVASIRENNRVQVVYESETSMDNAVAPVLATVTADVFLTHPQLHQEIFGPFSIMVLCYSFDQMRQVAQHLEGQLTASIHMNNSDSNEGNELVDILTEKAGRLIINGVPTGVEVSAAMTHGGPYPASSDSRFTAVGHHAIRRWVRPVTFQNFPTELLPGLLQNV